MTQIYRNDSIDTVVFHFNKKHLTDSKIPMWVLKTKGETFYVDHLDARIGFSTKETPDNPHTKGSLKFRGRLTIETIDDKVLALIQ